MARPKKKHSMEFLRQQAEKLFLIGKSGYQIAKELGITDQTVSNWKIKYGWAEKYEQIHQQHLQVKISEAFERTGENINELRAIQQAAIAPIKNKTLTPQYFGEATRAYGDALKLENELRQSSINTSFIQEIAKIILEEVSDVEVLTRIKVKIMELMQKDTKKIIALAGGNEILERDIVKDVQ